jgi:hypothetical protein
VLDPPRASSLCLVIPIFCIRCMVSYMKYNLFFLSMARLDSMSATGSLHRRRHADGN